MGPKNTPESTPVELFVPSRVYRSSMYPVLPLSGAYEMVTASRSCSMASTIRPGPEEFDVLLVNETEPPRARGSDTLDAV
jgi:hypothetical protein